MQEVPIKTWEQSPSWCRWVQKLNWLPTKERVYQCICLTIFNLISDMFLEYMPERFHPSFYRHNMHSSTHKLGLPFWNSSLVQKTLFYLGPEKWNVSHALTKLWNNASTLKHDIKKTSISRNFKRTTMTFLSTTSQNNFLSILFMWCTQFYINFYLLFTKGTIMNIRSILTCFMPSLLQYF